MRPDYGSLHVARRRHPARIRPSTQPLEIQRLVLLIVRSPPQSPRAGTQKGQCSLGLLEAGQRGPRTRDEAEVDLKSAMHPCCRLSSFDSQLSSAQLSSS